MPPLDYKMERTMMIQAERDIVFSFFTQSDRWATWWGAGSTIDPRPDGDLTMVHSNGYVSTGKVIEIEPTEKLVFTMSLQTNPPTTPDDSRVTIQLEDHPNGTRLLLTHELSNANVRDLMHQGWRFHLSLFSNAIADLVNKDAASMVDEWFALWTEPDAAKRSATLGRIASSSVQFRDRYSALDGPAEIETHIGASQRFMPGIRLERRGAIRHCQGTVLADWAALGKDDKERMSGTNVFLLVFGKIQSVTGVTNK